MIGLFIQKWATQLIAGTLVLACIGASVGYIKYQSTRIGFLETENFALTQQSEEYFASINMLYGRIAKQATLNAELEVKMRDSESQREELSNKFRKHKLNSLAKAKPEWIERIINNGTNKVFNDIESITTP